MERMISLLLRALLPLFLLSTLLSEKAIATGQMADYLIIDCDTFGLCSNPLEPYLQFKSERSINGVTLGMTSTACYRGYIAKWRIQNDSLFLVQLIRGIELDSTIVFNLTDEFGKDKVFASWYTGTILSPRGAELQYVHSGYSSIYETEMYYRIWNGKIEATHIKTNLIYDKQLLLPSESFLYDTIKHLIINRFTPDMLNQIPDSTACFLHVQFNENGKVGKIEIVDEKVKNTYFGTTLLKIGWQELTKLPPLMKVTHKYYRPPYLEIGFVTHCLKYPWDKEYGCKQ